MKCDCSKGSSTKIAASFNVETTLQATFLLGRRNYPGTAIAGGG